MFLNKIQVPRLMRPLCKIRATESHVFLLVIKCNFVIEDFKQILLLYSVVWLTKPFHIGHGSCFTTTCRYKYRFRTISDMTIALAYFTAISFATEWCLIWTKKMGNKRNPLLSPCDAATHETGVKNSFKC